MSTAFKVDTGALGLLAARTATLARATYDIGERVTKYAEPPRGQITQTYISLITPGLTNLYGQGRGFAHQAGQVIGALSQLVGQARDKYVRGDANAAAGFDAYIDDMGTPNAQAFAGRPKPVAASYGGDLGCTWPEDPLIHEGAPGSNPEFTFEFNVVTGDLLSITAYVSQFSEWLFGADPVEAFLKPFIGNWDALYASGVEFERYAKALTAIGHDLQWLSDQIPGFWDGNAAANCREQMLDLGGKIAATAPSFAKGAGAFKSAANDAWTAYDYASGFVRDAVDAIVPLAGEIKIGAKIPARAAGTVKFVKEIYQDLTKRADIIDSDIKLYNALPEGVKAPDLQIPGFSVTLGGWFHTSPKTTGK